MSWLKCVGLVVVVSFFVVNLGFAGPCLSNLRQEAPIEKRSPMLAAPPSSTNQASPTPAAQSADVSPAPASSKKLLRVQCDRPLQLVGVYAGDTLVGYFDDNPGVECQFRVLGINVPDPKSTNLLESQAGKALSMVIKELIKVNPATVTVSNIRLVEGGERWRNCYIADVYFGGQSLRDILLEEGLGKCDSNIWEPEELREIIRTSRELPKP